MPLYVLSISDGPVASDIIRMREDQALWDANAPLLALLPTARSVQPPKLARTGLWEAADIGDFQFKILDSVSPQGPHLVSMSQEQADIINSSVLALHAAPVKTYRLPSQASTLVAHPNPPKPTGQPVTFEVVCVDDETNTRMPGCWVVALTDIDANEGVAGSAEGGSIWFTLPSAEIAALYVAADHRYWVNYREKIPLTNVHQLRERVRKISLTTPDAVRLLYPQSRFDDTRKVRVGVVDTGVGPHRNLRVDLFRNTVCGEDKDKGEDSQGHGTHVAGLIAAKSDSDPQGLAPGVELYSYRAFGEGADTAMDYAIMKAIIHATWDRCDIINVSIESSEEDDCVRRAVAYARDNGALVIAAAGNGARADVSRLADYPGALAVTALGDRRGFPQNSQPAADIPTRNDLVSGQTFMAKFTNHGQTVDVVAPGVGVLSTQRGGSDYECRSGTSMAAPVVSGALASLLSREPGLVGADRNIDRSQAMEALLRSRCIDLGFPAEWQGSGMPDPTKV